MTTEIANLDLTAVAAAIRSRRISSLEATEACLARAERLAGRLNCFIVLDADGARAQARRADDRLSAGESVGPLHGVPMAHKDLFSREDQVATCGSRILDGVRGTTTATVLERLSRAGAIDIGRLHMSEFAAGGTGHNLHFGDCLNPWNTDYSPGGSSSGSASAVAARLIYGSLGTDTGGSLRWPAALCCLTTIRPTQGRVSLHGVMPRSWSLDTVGPLVRSIRDCALMLDVIAGADPQDPYCSALPVPKFLAAIEAPVSGLTLGVPVSGSTHDVDPETRTALAATLDVFLGKGVSVVKIEIPDEDLMFDLCDLISKAEAAALHETWLTERGDDYAAYIRDHLESGLLISAASYLNAMRLRTKVIEDFARSVFTRVDAIALPSYPGRAPTMAECDPLGPGNVDQFWTTFPRFTRPLSLLGIPIISCPIGIGSNGIPLGIQIAARPFDEETLFALGGAFQRATDWHRRAPDI